LTKSLRRLTLVLLATAFAAALPAFAGTIYVPVVLNSDSPGGFHRQTEVWATNSQESINGYYTYFIPSFADGTVRTTERGLDFLGPFETKQLTNLAAPGATGMLELDGAPAIHFSARIATYDAQQNLVDAVEVPIISSENLEPAGRTIYVQGWEKVGADRVTNVGFANLAQAQNHCTVDLRQRDGLLIVQGVQLTLPALTQVQFDDALSLLGLNAVEAGAKASVVCDQPFWVYASIYDNDNGEVHLSSPAASIAYSTLEVPSAPAGGGGGGGGEPGATVFELPGTYLACNSNNTGWSYTMNLGHTKSFTKVIVDFDVYISGWDPHKQDGWHQLLWLQEDAQHWDQMYGYLNATGPTQYKIILETQIGGADRQVKNENLTGKTVHVNYTYDTGSRTNSYRISQNGNTLINGGYGIPLHSIQTDGMFLAQGTWYADSGPEATTFGWKFSNLRVQYVP
jgi:hypothetical protein